MAAITSARTDPKMIVRVRPLLCMARMRPAVDLRPGDGGLGVGDGVLRLLLGCRPAAPGRAGREPVSRRAILRLPA